MSWFLALRTLFGAKNLVEAKVQNEKCLRESRREFDYHGIKIVETYDSKGHRYFNDEEIEVRYINGGDGHFEDWYVVKSTGCPLFPVDWELDEKREREQKQQEADAKERAEAYDKLAYTKWDYRFNGSVLVEVKTGKILWGIVKVEDQRIPCGPPTIKMKWPPKPENEYYKFYIDDDFLNKRGQIMGTKSYFPNNIDENAVPVRISHEEYEELDLLWRTELGYHYGLPEAAQKYQWWRKMHPDDWDLNYKKYNPLKNAMTPFFNNEIKPDRRKEGEALKQRSEEERIRRGWPRFIVGENEWKIDNPYAYMALWWGCLYDPENCDEFGNQIWDADIFEHTCEAYEIPTSEVKNTMTAQRPFYVTFYVPSMSDSLFLQASVPAYKVCSFPVKFLCLIPEQHMSGMFKKYGSGAWNVLSHPHAAMPVKHIALSGDAH